MNTFDFLNDFAEKGLRLPVICYCDPQSVTKSINELLDYLTSKNIPCLHVNTASPIEMNNQLKWLGEEIEHVILDATEGIHLKGFLGLSGKLKRGSLLFLFLSDRKNALSIHDRSSSSWFNFSYHENQPLITAPLFNTFLHNCIDSIAHCEIELSQHFNWHQLPDQLKAAFNKFLNTHSQSSPIALCHALTDEQKNAFYGIMKADYGINLLSAKRGRGKTYTLKYLIHHLFSQDSKFILTGIRKALYTNHSPMIDFFIAPDALEKKIEALKYTSDCTYLSDWLIIDEAAAISLSAIKKWIPFFNKILLVTTLEGYEGSGQALSLKLESLGYKINHFELKQPIRFSADCPLNKLSQQLMITDKKQMFAISKNSQIELCTLKRISNNTVISPHITDDLQFTTLSKFSINTINTAQSVYVFLKHVHYQTTPNDFRRLLDGQNQHFFIFSSKTIKNNINDLNVDDYLQIQPIKAAAWVLLEGGAEIDLAKKIWIGERRPKANLVAQSLATHGNNPRFPTLKGLRISRIGVSPLLRRQNIATHLVQEIIQNAVYSSQDYISVSFGYEKHLLRFWTQLGFQLVHISHTADASSGQKSVMMIYPISKMGFDETYHCITHFQKTIEVISALNLNSSHQIFNQEIEIYHLFKSHNSHKSFEPLYDFKGKKILNSMHDTIKDSNKQIENDPFYCLCAFAFHYKAFSSILPSLYQLSRSLDQWPSELGIAWHDYINFGNVPKKHQTHLLRSQLRHVLTTHYQSKVINYNDWLSDKTSFIIK